MPGASAPTLAARSQIAHSRSHGCQLFCEEAEPDAVLPRAGAVVRLAARALVREARTLEDALRGGVEAVDLGLDAVDLALGDEEPRELPDRARREALAAASGVDHQRPDVGDPAAAVHEHP